MVKLKPYIYVLLGPQGSGKGTQGNILKNRLGLPLAVSGDIIRSEVEKGSELGIRAGELIDRGELVTIDLWKDIMGEYLKKQDLTNGILLDGSPRTKQQASALEELINDNSFPQIKVLHLALPRKIALERLTKRRVCKKDGQPLTSDFCDEHQVETTTRKDDTAEAIERRLDLYFEQTEPLLAYYREDNSVIDINGNQRIEEVSTEIIDSLKKHELVYND